jgi:predicted nucleotidyltransferase
MLNRLVAATGLELDVRVRRSRPRSLRLKGPLGARVRTHRREMKRIAARHGLTNLRLFGSVARGDETDESDIDLLVDIAPGVGLLGLAQCQHELQSLLHGAIDLVPAGDLKPRVARAVFADAVVI